MTSAEFEDEAERRSYRIIRASMRRASAKTPAFRAAWQEAESRARDSLESLFDQRSAEEHDARDAWEADAYDRAGDR
jgi:hypothetical protein